MAKPLAPLFSFIAKGTIAKLITFDRYAKTNIARIIPTHKDANTVAQQLQRTKFQEAAEEWYLMTPAEKAAYETEGTKHHMTGYAWFMRAFLLNPAPRTFLELEDTPDSYVAQALKFPRVNAGEDGLEFATVSLEPDYPMKLKPNTTRWTVPGWACTSTQSVSLILGALYYIPIFISETTTYIRIAINVSTAASGKLARLGIYNFAAGLPGTLILDAGTVSVGTTGSKQIVISQAITRKYAFLAIVSDGSPGLTGWQPTAIHQTPLSGLTDDPFTAPRVLVLAKSGCLGDVAGGLQNPAREPDTLITSIGFAGIVMLREN